MIYLQLYVATGLGYTFGLAAVSSFDRTTLLAGVISTAINVFAWPVSLAFVFYTEAKRAEHRKRYLQAKQRAALEVEKMLKDGRIQLLDKDMLARLEQHLDKEKEKSEVA